LTLFDFSKKLKTKKFMNFKNDLNDDAISVINDLQENGNEQIYVFERLISDIVFEVIDMGGNLQLLPKHVKMLHELSHLRSVLHKLRNGLLV